MGVWTRTKGNVPDGGEWKGRRVARREANSRINVGPKLPPEYFTERLSTAIFPTHPYSFPTPKAVR
jgi:hypothetical protein